MAYQAVNDHPKNVEPIIRVMNDSSSSSFCQDKQFHQGQGIFLAIWGIYRGPWAFQTGKISAANPLIGKELCALRGFFGPPPMRLKMKIVFHQFILINLLEQ